MCNFLFVIQLNRPTNLGFEILVLPCHRQRRYILVSFDVSQFCNELEVSFVSQLLDFVSELLLRLEYVFDLLHLNNRVVSLTFPFI